MRDVLKRQTDRLGDWFVRRAGPGGAVAAGFQNMERGRYDVAAKAFADAERLYRERGAPSVRVAEMAAYRAWCYTKLNRASEAIPLYERAIDLERQAGATPERIAQLREQLDWASTRLNS